MPDIQTSSLKGYLVKSFVDAAAVACSLLAVVHSADYGAVATGITTGALFPLMLMSGMALTTRLLCDLKSETNRDVANQTGFHLMGKALKNSFSDAKNAAILTGMMGVVGLGTWSTMESIQQAGIEREAARAEWNKRPVMPLNTIIERREIKAIDHCYNRNGNKLPTGSEVGIVYNNVSYRIICP